MASDLASPMTPTPARVANRVTELDDTVTITLDVDDSMAAPRPGQFAMLWAFGVGEIPISFSGWGPAGWEHTIRGVGSVSEALCAASPGDTLGVRGPFGTGWPLEAAVGGDVLLVAGGLGLAPLRPALRAILDHRASYERVAVLLGARSPETLLYAQEVTRWQARADLDVLVTVDYASSSWRGDVGVVTRLLPRSGVDPDACTALVCGPEVMMRFTADRLSNLGIAPERIHLSLERNMKCAVGHCGRCQLGPTFVCRNGPVLDRAVLGPLLGVRQL